MYSLLDTDLYKFLVGQVIYNNYPDLHVRYKLFDRKNKVLPIWGDIRPLIEKKVDQYFDCILKEEEELYLRSLNTFKEAYINYLTTYRNYDIIINLNNGIEISGPWVDTVLWEVPLLQFVNEAYAEITEQQLDSNIIISRVDSLKGFNYSEFGSRRRISQLSQELAIQRMKFNGNTKTSNLYFAKKYNLTPVGTFGHEAVSGLSAIVGEDEAQYEVIRLMKKEFPNRQLLALTDTFTTKHFLKRFIEVEHLTNGVRQDSGRPTEIMCDVIDWYLENSIDYSRKHILFSDDLNNLKCRDILGFCERIESKMSHGFGIGTFLTSSGESSGTVLKIIECNGKQVRKLSDDPAKSIGV